MERCPTCQARLRDAPVCPRCKTDLTRLLDIESAATAWLHRALALLAEGNEAQVLRTLESSLRLKREPLALLVQGFLCWRAQLAAEDNLAQASAPEPVAGEPLQATECATDHHGKIGQLIDRAAGLAEKILHTIHLPPSHLPEKQPNHHD
jgi:hypothetical protein